MSVPGNRVPPGPVGRNVTRFARVNGPSFAVHRSRALILTVRPVLDVRMTMVRRAARMVTNLAAPTAPVPTGRMAVAPSGRTTTAHGVPTARNRVGLMARDRNVRMVMVLRGRITTRRAARMARNLAVPTAPVPSGRMAPAHGLRMAVVLRDRASMVPVAPTAKASVGRMAARRVTPDREARLGRAMRECDPRCVPRGNLAVAVARFAGVRPVAIR